MATPALSSRIRPEHVEMLIGSAITPEVLDRSGIWSTPDSLAFPWSDGVHPSVVQYRPDNPRLDDDGKPVKYLFPKGARVPLNRLRDDLDAQTPPSASRYGKVVIAEGTKQCLAVLSHAPEDYAVYGMSGCWGYKHADLSVVEGRDVFLLLDADLETNPDVWAAAGALTKRLTLSGAKSVAYVATPGSGKQGVDDVLAAVDPQKRPASLNRWLNVAPTRLPRRPKAKRPSADSNAAKLFEARDEPLKFLPLDGANWVLEQSPAALTREGAIALYRDGVFTVDPDAVTHVMALKLGNMYEPAHVKKTTDVLAAMLSADRRFLPERMSQPLLNCVNGMVDLRTGELKPHDPSYLSSLQVGLEYLPDLATPVYDAWLASALRRHDTGDGDLAALIADLEETAGTMLDPTRTPSKALFLFGESRSGKSTFLRLLKAVAGAANTSAVTLQALSKDVFATANLYNRMLNVAADLSNEHVSDLSAFKMATGEDPLQANRKYGRQFEFTNQALFAFSANDLPTVSEASRAYMERVKPFEFPNSFAGSEDKTLEGRLMAELPGILARWVAAYGRFLDRGGYGPTDLATQEKFEAKSDRVAQFFQDMCTVTTATHGQTLDATECTGRRDVSVKFNAWAERNGSSKMGERAFFQRLSRITGVVEVRTRSKGRAYNLVVAGADDDTWEDDGAGQNVEAAPAVDLWAGVTTVVPEPKPEPEPEAVEAPVPPVEPVPGPEAQPDTAGAADTPPEAVTAEFRPAGHPMTFGADTRGWDFGFTQQ